MFQRIKTKNDSFKNNCEDLKEVKLWQGADRREVFTSRLLEII